MHNSTHPPQTSPSARFWRVGLTALWALACVGGSIALWRTLHDSAQPKAAMVSMLVEFDPTPGQGLRASIETIDGGTRQAKLRQAPAQGTTLWQVSIEPDPAQVGAVEVLAIQTDAGPIFAGQLGGHAWHAGYQSSGLATDDAAPLRFVADGQWLAVALAGGPGARDAIVRVNGEPHCVSLADSERQAEFVVSGAARRVVALDLFDTESPAVLRLVHDSGKPVRIVSASSTRGDVLAEPGAALSWSAPRPPAVASATLVTILAGLAVFFYPWLHLRSKRTRDARVGALVRTSAWSLALSGALALLFYPGIASNDGWIRATHAAEGLGGSLVPQSMLMADWFPPLLSLLMSAGHRVTGEWGALTFLQAWFCLAAIGLLLVAAAGPRWGPRAFWLIALFPPVWNHAAAMLPDAWTTGALCLAAGAILWRFPPSFSRANDEPAPWFFAAFAFACMILFTMRANAITVAPLLAILALWLIRPWRRAGLALACIGAGVATAAYLPRATGWRRVDTAAASLVWEHVAMLHRAQDPDLMERHSIDFAGRFPGATAAAIETFPLFPVSHDLILLAPDAPLDLERVRTPDGSVRNAWWSLVKERPALYAGTKLSLWRGILGARGFTPLNVIEPRPTAFAAAAEPLAAPENNYSPWEATYGPDLRPEPLLGDAGARLVSAWANFSTQRGWIYRPYVVLLAALAGIVVLKVRRQPIAAPVVLFLLAASYFGGFLVLAPGLNWRYLMPAFALCFAAIAHACVALTNRRLTIAYGDVLEPAKPVRMAA